MLAAYVVDVVAEFSPDSIALGVVHAFFEKAIEGVADFVWGEHAKMVRMVGSRDETRAAGSAVVLDLRQSHISLLF